jgi:hypothetical protein
MKLSEAIILGSTVLTSKAGGQHFSNQSGCALGMAAVARGCEFGPAQGPVDARSRRTLGTEDVWGNWVTRIVMRPCDCWRFRVPREMPIKDIIAHLFDYHVMSKKNWTLERLATWVKTFEPEEVPLPEMPNPFVSLQSITAQYEERRREVQEWTAVRQSFEAKHEVTHSARRRRGPTSA